MSASARTEHAAVLRRFKTYPSYKDPGVEWLGEIPEHGEVKRLKTVAAVQFSNVDKKSVEGQEWATGSPFETKDVLKARQYRWDADVRCWWRELDAGALEAELAWLKTAVYAGRAAAIDIDLLDARVRYSARTGKREKRTL